MANTIQVLKYGHCRIARNAFDQTLTAPRNHHVHDAVKLDHGRHGLSIRCVEHLDRLRRQAGGFKSGLNTACKDKVGAKRLRATAQQHGITRLQTEACGIDRDIGT